MALTLVWRVQDQRCPRLLRALALTAAVTDPPSVAPRDPVEIACSAPNVEVLLVDWLNALVFEMATRGMLFSRFDTAIEGTELTATAWGEPVDISRHAPAVEVKGATCTELFVGRDNAGEWTARCVVDV
jgi:SHS2 domain-containing protein